MKITITCILLWLLGSSVVSAQKMPSDYFDEGVDYAEAEDYANALASFNYIVLHHPKNELYPKALFNVGFLCYSQKMYDSAGAIFKNMIKGNFNEKDPLGGGIMDDPYANYKHRASELLSDIYFNKAQYDSALYYFSMADTVYPYLHFCGNEYASNRIHEALRYSEIYRKLGKDDMATAALLPVVFETLASTSEVADTLKVLLKGKPHLKQDLDSALNNIYSKTISNGKNSYQNYYITFLKTEIIIPVAFADSENFNTDDRTYDKTKTIESIRETAFYKMIAKMK